VTTAEGTSLEASADRGETGGAVSSRAPGLHYCCWKTRGKARNSSLGSRTPKKASGGEVAAREPIIGSRIWVPQRFLGSGSAASRAGATKSSSFRAGLQPVRSLCKEQSGWTPRPQGTPHPHGKRTSNSKGEQSATQVPLFPPFHPVVAFRRPGPCSGPSLLQETARLGTEPERMTGGSWRTQTQSPPCQQQRQCISETCSFPPPRGHRTHSDTCPFPHQDQGLLHIKVALLLEPPRNVEVTHSLRAHF
jgi:hypothetical protein